MIAALPNWASDSAEVLGIIAGALLALAVIGRLVVMPVVHVVKAIASGVEAVQQQLIPNGGASLRDATDRLEAGVARIDSRIEVLETWRLDADERIAKAIVAAKPKPAPRKKATP
jgi:hypothetical protein